MSGSERKHLRAKFMYQLYKYAQGVVTLVAQAVQQICAYL